MALTHLPLPGTDGHRAGVHLLSLLVGVRCGVCVDCVPSPLHRAPRSHPHASPAGQGERTGILILVVAFPFKLVKFYGRVHYSFTCCDGLKSHLNNTNKDISTFYCIHVLYLTSIFVP